MSKQIHQTRMGKKVDLHAIINKNQHVIALGNASMNARGDIIGKNGTVSVTREQITNEYKKREAQVVQSPRNNAIMPDVFETPTEAIERLKKKELLLQKPQIYLTNQF